MLSMSKPLSSGQVKDYYKKDYTAKENYWQQDANMPGVWTGKLAGEMGLSGQVDHETFSRLADGKHPSDEAQLIRHNMGGGYTKADGTEVSPKEHRAGWDAVFSAPKSVSLTGLVGGDERVLAAHNMAVDIALSRLEKYVQAHPGNNNPPVTTGKMIAAKFEHHTARPVDGYAAPQLHTHVVIFNMTQRADGKFNSIQTKAMFDSQQYATSVYQSELTYQLRQMGYEIVPGKSGAPEIKGYTQEYLDASSPRRAQIEEALDKAGYSSPEAAQMAAMGTRSKKQIANQEEQTEAHRVLAEKFGNQPEKVIQEAATRLEQRLSGEATLAPGENGVSAKTAVTYAKEHNAERESVVDERDIMRDALRRGMGFVRTEDIEKEVGSRLERGEFRRVEQERTEGVKADKITFIEAIKAERSVIQTMLDTQDTMQQIMPKDEALSYASIRLDKDNLSDLHKQAVETQKRAVAEVLSSTDKITGLQGLAGTGKTTTLKVIKDAAEKQGYVVRAFAPTSRATQVIREEGISADTFQGFLAKGGEPSQNPHLYLLDESSFASTTQMDKFMKKIGPDDRVLLIGDTGQHQGVEAGKPFEQLQSAGMKTAQLDTIIRQSKQDLRSAVEDFSKGKVDSGLGKLAEQGRIHEIKEASARYDEISKRYCESPNSSIIVSPDNASRRALNVAVRDRLKEQGIVSSEDHAAKILVTRSDFTGADRSWAERYRVGEYIAYQNGSKKFGIEKGEFAKVESIDTINNLLTVNLQGRSVEYNPTYLRGVTVYKELDREFSVGDKLQFTAQNKKLAVTNRDLATIKGVDQQTGKFTVETGQGTGKREIVFDPKEMRTFDHGYAVTSHSSQGITTNRVFVNADLETHKDLINQRFTYVACSRMRDELQVFTNDLEKLGVRMAKDVSKTSAIDAREMAVETTQETQEEKHAEEPAQEIDRTTVEHAADHTHVEAEHAIKDSAQFVEQASETQHSVDDNQIQEGESRKAEMEMVIE